MATVFIRHHVKDYGTWKPLFDEHQPVRKEHGVTGHSLYRRTEDPNDLIIAMRTPNLNGAKEFATSEELRTTMQRAGVEGSPEIWFTEDVEEKRY